MGAGRSVAAARGKAKTPQLYARRGVQADVPYAAERDALPTADRPSRVRDVHMRYASSRTIGCCGASIWRRRQVAIHAIVGGNGCGKSTLLRVIAGVLKPERGRVDNRLAACQALLPQDPKTLFVCDSVADELHEWQKACGYDDSAVDDALLRFGLAGRATSHPYDVSGGEQQKLAFAKLLLAEPELLLLDEPTKGLDAPSKLTVGRMLRERARAGTTIVMATHDLSFAALVSDTVTMVFDGEAACTEPAADFFANNLFYRPAQDAFARRYGTSNAG